MGKKRTSRTSTKTSQKSSVSPPIIAGVAVAAVLLVVGLIILGNQSQSSGADIDLSGYPTMGNENAPVTIVEYSDLGCPHCRDFVLEKFDQLEQEYIEAGQVKYVVAPYYLGRSEIGFATEAAMCANAQGAFFEYQKALFENQGQLSINQESMGGLAANLGLDTEAFAQCLSARTFSDTVEAARTAGVRRGVNSTPTFFINNQRVEGNQPYSIFQQIIEQEQAMAQ